MTAEGAAAATGSPATTTRPGSVTTTCGPSAVVSTTPVTLSASSGSIEGQHLERRVAQHDPAHRRAVVQREPVGPEVDDEAADTHDPADERGQVHEVGVLGSIRRRGAR